MRIERSARFYVCINEHLENGHSSDMELKEVVFHSRIQTARRMGKSRWTNDDRILRKRTPSFPCHESIVSRNAQKQRWWKIISALLRWPGNDWNFFAQFISVNQLSVYGAVSNLCEECKACHVRAGGPILVRQSDPIVFAKCDEDTTFDRCLCARKNLLRRYQERVERLSQQNRVINFCTDGGSLTAKYGVEIRIESVNTKAILTRGSEFVIAWISWSRTSATRRTTTTSRKPLRLQFEDCALKTNVLAFASRSKGQSKKKNEDISCQLIHKKLYPLGKELGVVLNHKIIRPSMIQVSKQLGTLLRHGNLLREDDGAIEFWRWKDYLRNHVEQSQHWSDEKWKSTMAGGGGNKKRF